MTQLSRAAVIALAEDADWYEIADPAPQLEQLAAEWQGFISQRAANPDRAPLILATDYPDDAPDWSVLDAMRQLVNSAEGWAAVFFSDEFLQVCLAPCPAPADRAPGGQRTTPDALVHRILALRHEEHRSPASIAQHLNAEGVTTPSGTKWLPGGVTNVLRSRYAAELRAAVPPAPETRKEVLAS